MTASFTLLVLSSKDRGASSPSILYPKEESGSHCLLIFVLKPRSAGLKFGSTIYLNTLLSNGFIINHIVEPQPPENMMDIPGMADEMRRPMMLIVSAKKKM